MKSVLTFAAFVGALAAVVNASGIPNNPNIKGWVFGIGILAFIGFGLWAILLETS